MMTRNRCLVDLIFVHHHLVVTPLNSGFYEHHFNTTDMYRVNSRLQMELKGWQFARVNFRDPANKIDSVVSCDQIGTDSWFFSRLR